MSIPKNIFLSASKNDITTLGNLKVINIDNKVNVNLSKKTKEISQDNQIDLYIIKCNIEVTKKSLGARDGVSLLGSLDLNIGIDLNEDIKNSEIYLSGIENINKDNNSISFSVGIKPVNIIIGIGNINNSIRRILSPTLLEPSLYTPIFGPIKQEHEIH